MLKKVYIAHPGFDKEIIRVWQIETQKKIDSQNLNFILFNPFFDSGTFYCQQHQAGEKVYAEEVIPEIVVSADKKNISNSQILLAVLWGNAKSIGTYMEIALAKILNPEIQVYVVTTSEFIYSHPWIRFHSDKVFSRLYDFEQEILFNNL